MNIKDAMVGNVCTCRPETSLEDVARIMWEKDCGSVPVVDEQQRPVGIITDRDIAIGSVLQHKALWEICARDITNSRPLFTCKQSDDIKNALELMREQSIRRLPVVDAQGKLVGLISMGDIIACAGTDKSAKLALNDMAGMLKSVSGHHSAQLQAA